MKTSALLTISTIFALSHCASSVEPNITPGTGNSECGEPSLPHLVQPMPLHRFPEPMDPEMIEITVRPRDGAILTRGTISILVANISDNQFRLVAGGAEINLENDTRGQEMISWLRCEREHGREHNPVFQVFVERGTQFAVDVNFQGENPDRTTRPVELGSYHAESAQTICRSSGDTVQIQSCINNVCADLPVIQRIETVDRIFNQACITVAY